jgi:hypothetical protein
MKRNWQLCRHDDSGRHLTQHVTLNRAGEISLGRYTYEKLGQPEKVLLLYDAVTHTIGVQPTSGSAKHGFRIVPLKSGGRIHARRLTAEFNLKVPHTLRFTTAEFDPDGILLLDLNNTRPAIRGENGKPRKVLVAEGDQH